MTHAVWKTSGLSIKKADTLVADILASRGIDDPDSFLKVSKKQFHNPYKMKDMKLAVPRIIKAVQAGETIGIYGDYDADGVSSTSLWVLVLRSLGATVHYFIPDRFHDGYGVNKRGLDVLRAHGCSLLITCDTGVTAIEQVEYAKQIGFDVIVTDHHEPQEIAAYAPDLQAKGQHVDGYLLPSAIVVNPKRPDCRYPFKSLAGVGVSFKVLCAVCEKLHPNKRKAVYEYLDIVALGTFADMMEIRDENRIIGHYGLRKFNRVQNRGLYQLLRANELNGKTITSQDIGWSIAPCINAAGRIVSAEDAVEMIVSNNKLDAYRWAKSLVEINQQRKDMTKMYVEAILKSVEADQALNPTSMIIHYYPGIPEGIVGLIASRMMNHFYKPSIILTDAEEEGVYKGSGRSITGFNLFLALMKQTSIMEGFGGHAAACGLSLTKENYPELKSRMELYADSMLSPKDLQPVVRIDAAVDGPLVDEGFVKEVMKLEPFGATNPKPTFLMRDVFIIKAKPVGDDKNHFWALVSNGKKTFSTIGFFLWEKYEELGEPKKLDVAFFPDLNEYPKGSGKINVQLKIEDIRKVTKK